MCRNSIIKDRKLVSPNVIELSDEDTPLESYMSIAESDLSSDNETPRFPDISDDDSDISDISSDIDNFQRHSRIRSR